MGAPLVFLHDKPWELEFPMISLQDNSGGCSWFPVKESPQVFPVASSHSPFKFKVTKLNIGRAKCQLLK